MLEFPEILLNSRFYVGLKLDGSSDPVDAYFLECKGFKISQEAIEHYEVTPQRWGKAKSGLVALTKIPSNLKTNNITLRRGMTKSMTLWHWFNEVQKGNWAKQVRSGFLNIYDQAGKAQAVFQFKGAWPVSYIVSDVSANSTEVEIEEMEIAVEMFTRDLI